MRSGCILQGIRLTDDRPQPAGIGEPQPLDGRTAADAIEHHVDVVSQRLGPVWPRVVDELVSAELACDSQFAVATGRGNDSCTRIARELIQQTADAAGRSGIAMTPATLATARSV